MSAHRYKRVEKPRKSRAPRPPRGYHPAALVRARGDSWRHGIEGRGRGYVSAATVVALRDETFDRHEAFVMTYMEKGVLPRIEFIGSDE